MARNFPSPGVGSCTRNELTSMDLLQLKSMSTEFADSSSSSLMTQNETIIVQDHDNKPLRHTQFDLKIVPLTKLTAEALIC
jgi:hypothetical protein